MIKQCWAPILAYSFYLFSPFAQATAQDPSIALTQRPAPTSKTHPRLTHATTNKKKDKTQSNSGNIMIAPPAPAPKTETKPAIDPLHPTLPSIKQQPAATARPVAPIASSNYTDTKSKKD